MKLTKSEYQNQFRTSVAQKGQALYEENLNLRYQRRDRQFLHTPICWGEENDEELDLSDSSESLAEDVKAVKKKREPEPQYQSLAEILDETRDKNLAFRRRQREIDNGCTVPDTENDSANFMYNGFDSQECKKILSDKTLDEFVNEENKKLNKKLAQISLTPEETEDTIHVDEDKEIQHKAADRYGKQSKFNLRKKIHSKKRNQDSRCSDNKSNKSVDKKDSQCPSCVGANSVVSASVPSFTKLKRPDRQARVPRTKLRPTSASMSNQGRPPFMQYGSGDREDCLAFHRTHNVRSSADVYPPALKAKQRLEEGKKRQKEKILRAQSAEALIDQLASATPRDSIDWMSEYQKQFHVYDAKEYERALTSRAVISHSVPIRAVHRGGCLIINVE